MGRILSFVLATSLVALEVNAATFQHVGKAVDYHTGQPVPVRGTAYIHVTPSTDECPAFKDLFLVEAETRKDAPGLFRFFVDANRKSYGAVFCSNDYYSRVEPGLQNTEDGPAFPHALGMFAKKDRNQLPDDVRSLLDDFEAELRYLRSVNQDVFDKTVAEWSEGRHWKQFGEALLGLLNLKRN